jgi:hypothetical protein
MSRIAYDGEQIADGWPGPVSRRLRDFYLAHAAAA